MLRQIEGSRAVAETVALLPAGGRRRLPDLAADPHRRGARRAGRVRARWRRASTSTSSRSSRRCRSASAPRRPAPAPTRPPPARGCCSWPRRSTTPPASACPIVMTVANRAHRLADQHLERPLRRDVAARLGLDPALRGVQPGGGRPARPGVPPGRGALAAGDGLHGRLRPHPRRRARRRARRRSRSTRSCRRSSPRQVLDPDDPMTIGAMVGPEAFTEVKYLMHAKQMQALDAIPAHRRTSSRRRSAARSGGLVRAYRTEDAETVVVALGSVLGTIEDVVDELRDAGRARRRARRHLLPARGRSTRCAPRWRRARRVVVVEKALRRRRRRDRRARTSALALERPAASRSTTSSPGSAAGRSRAASLHRPARATRSPAGWAPLTFLDLDRELVERELAAARTGPLRPARREHAARRRHRRGRVDLMPYQPVKFYQSGSFAVGNRLLDPEQRTVQSDPRALEHAHLGAPRLPGLRRGARRALRARRRDARHRRPAGRRQRDRLPGGLLDAVPRERRGSCRGSTRCSATPRRSRPASPPRCGPRAATTSASSARAATAARSTSASAACRGCSSATTTCSSSATTTRAT